MKIGGDKMILFKKNRGKKYSELLDEWLKDKKNNIKIQSYQKYDSIIFKIKEELGDLITYDLQDNHFISFFQIQKDKEVSISVQKTMLYIINSSLSYGYKLKYCNYIDLKDIKLKTLIKNIQVFSKEEQKIIENNAKEKMNIRKLCLLLCLYTGLRIGEISGLKWEDINFSSKSLEIKRTIERIKNTDETNHAKTLLIASTPKSETSKRIVPIPDFLILFLQEFKTKDHYYILSNSEKLYDPRQLESFYTRFLKKCNVNYANFHTLRHTFATRSIESKMDIKTLSEILGHSSIEITLKLYVHPSYELKKASIYLALKFLLIIPNSIYTLSFFLRPLIFEQILKITFVSLFTII